MKNKIQKLISQLKPKIEKFFASDDDCHNVDHLKRTLHYALELQKEEGGDIEVIAVSAFIHDVHRIMQNQLKRWVHPKESIPKLREIISDLDLTDAQKNHICHAIEYHEEYAFGDGVSVKDIETLILQDADNLDAVGPIAIMRTIQYNTLHKMPMYSPEIPLYRNNFDEGKHDVSMIHHIYNKLLRLGENMNTKTAREICKPKTKLMQDYVDMFIKEWK